MQDLSGIIHRNLRAVAKALGGGQIKLSLAEAEYLGVAKGEYSANIINDMLDLREKAGNSARFNALSDLVED